ncbi:uncharacterized protein LOC142178076 [Nicotiana tabacum]|uniref:Uncharacterized protein LOC142178076 n=1 Tax=Nicotiana tabacum TaxID=4097 RepID=A0AC58U1Z0_TOBAC
MPKRGPKLNHLAYADDTVFFCGGKGRSIKLVMKQVRLQEKSSGQQVNQEKSFFCTASNTSISRIDRMIYNSSFKHKQFPFTYIGVPLYVGRKKLEFFNDLLTKITKRINGWLNKLLSCGGKVTLIKHVLQAIPSYTLAAMDPPKGTFKLIEMHFASFFWGSSNEK